MTRLFIIMLFVLMSFSGIAMAEERFVYVEGIGEIGESAVRVMEILCEKKRDEALAQYNKSTQQNTKSEVVSEKSVEPAAVQEVSAKDAISVPKSHQVSADQRIWGSFPELSLWTGAWKNTKADTQGGWFDLKYLQWYTKFEEPENFGIGARLRGDYGWKSGSKADWGYIAPGVAAGYYRGLGLRNSFETDAALLYRIDKVRENGLMPVGHVEFNHILGYKDRLIFQIDGSYFPGDSWLGPGAYWEHKLGKDWKTIVGIGGSLSWLDGDFFAGLVPSVKVKYKNRFTLGVSATLFTGLGPFSGIIAAYESTPDISTWYAEFKQQSIKLKREMKNNEVPQNDSMGIEFKTYQQKEEEETR